jgi:hypothetical protein
MIPSAFVVLDALPVAPTGKVDRKRLPAPEAPTRRDRPPPQTDTERLVARIWQEELGLEGVGQGDHFFDLGGHSLAAVRVAGQLRTALGRDVPVVTLFREPVLERFAALLTERAPPTKTLASAKEQAAKGAAAMKRLGRDWRGKTK